MIHPSAIVSAKAKLGSAVKIGPYAVIEDGVEIGDESIVESHAVLREGACIGKSVTVGNFAAIGGLPQDLSFDPATRSYARIGDGTTIREGATVNRATAEEGSTVLGENCFLMAGSHVGHDCQLGKRVILANEVMLAGHVAVGDSSFFGGGVGVHQFCRIGEGAMVGGHASLTMDVPPFTTVAERNALFGLNLIGLRRLGFSRDTIKQLQGCYRSVLMDTGKPQDLASALLERDGADWSEEARRFLTFFLEGKRGFARPGRGGK